jgi:hypothetical protein
VNGGGALILGGSGSLSSSVTGMPCLINASVVTAPTGPAPTTITRSSCCMTNSKPPHHTPPRAQQSPPADQTFEISNIDG